ncbi:MAG: hypothetical protein ACFHHU_00315 [Porticoccaceae bacterium]
MNNAKKTLRTLLLASVACGISLPASAEGGSMVVPEYIVTGGMPPSVPEAPKVTKANASEAVEANAQAVDVEEKASNTAHIDDEKNTLVREEMGEAGNMLKDAAASEQPVVSASLEDEIRDHERSRGVGARPKEEEPNPCSNPTQLCTITVNTGQLEMLKLSSLHMNRLVTPFSRPEIVTTDQDNFKHDITGNSIYFQPKDGSRSVLYLREKGTEDPVIQLAVTGSNVVPRQIALEFADGTYYRPNGQSRSQDDQEPSMTAPSVMQQVRAEFTKVAQMGVPDGFNLVHRSERLPEFCENHNGVTFSFKDGQKLSGADYDIYVGVVDNQTAYSVQLDETWCAAQSVMAVAFWEDVLLPAGHQSEVYVAARHQDQPTYSERKSLIKGGN